MKVLWVTELYPPAKGGVANSAKRIVNNLRSKGVTVDVITASNTGTGLSEDIAPPFCEVEGGIELTIKHQAKTHNTLQVMYHNIRRMHRLRKYDLLQGFFAVPAGYIAAYSAKTLKLPCVVSFRGNDIDQVLFDYANKPFLNDTLKWADCISYASEEMLNNLKILKPEGFFCYTPISVNADLYNCNNDQLLKSTKIKQDYCPNAERLLGIVGEFKFKKGLRFLLQTLPGIQKLEKTRLLVMGAISKKDEAVVLNNPWVNYKEYISANDMPLYYAAMDFLVIPSIFEGMPNVMLESMAAGTVNITSDIAGMRDVIADNYNGFRFFPLDQEDFLCAVKRAYELSPQAFHAFKQRAKERARDFTPQRETDSFLHLYSEAIRRGKNAW